MPVSKRRLDVDELLNHAVRQQGKVVETKKEILLRPTKIWLKAFKPKEKQGSDRLSLNESEHENNGGEGKTSEVNRASLHKNNSNFSDRSDSDRSFNVGISRNKYQNNSQKSETSDPSIRLTTFKPARPLYDNSAASATGGGGDESGLNDMIPSNNIHSFLKGLNISQKSQQPRHLRASQRNLMTSARSLQSDISNHVGELIVKGKERLHKSQQKLNVQLDNGKLHFWWYKFAVVLSLNCERFLWFRAVRILQIICWPVAFAVLAYFVPQLDYSVNNSTDFNFWVLDNIINAWFLLYSIIRMCGLFMRIKIEKAYQRVMTTYDALMTSGLLQFLTVVLCFGFGFTEVGMWMRLLRLGFTTSTVLEVFPHINVLMSGVTHGLRSISYAVLVLFLLILSYASVGHYLFAVNDPFHFGTYAQAALTFFQLSTFENWSTVFYTNFGGCDSFPNNEYNGVKSINETVMVSTGYGDFILPLCTTPQAQPVAASLVFVSFAILGGYVMISMCLAAVAIGINERLQALRKQAVYGGDVGGEGNGQTRSVRVGLDGGAKVSKLTGNVKEKALMKALLFKAWNVDTASTAGTVRVPGRMNRAQSIRITGNTAITRPNLEKGDDEEEHVGAMDNALFMHTLLNSKYHDAAISCLIALDACLQISDEGKAYTLGSYVIHVVVQVLLYIDLGVRLYDTDGKKRKAFLMNFWNIFDFVIGAILFATMGTDQQAWLRFLRIVRLVRIMKMYSTTFGDLLVILNSLANSFICVLYVLALLSLFFLVFSIGGVLLFKQANPYYFGTVVSSLKTLLQVMTQDNWSDVMRTCMIGCRAFGYNTGTTTLDTLCNSSISGVGVGWLGAAYFVSFMIMSSMVLANLMVGVIISSMELLREGFNEESLVWENVRRLQRTKEISAKQVHRMLELWEMLDKGSNGVLSFEETQPIMDLVNIKKSMQYEIYLKNDINKNGQMNFDEFCHLLLDLDSKRKDPLNLDTPETLKAMIDAAKHLRQSSKVGLLGTVMGAGGGASGSGDSGGSGGSGKRANNMVEAWAQNRIFAINESESNYDADNEKKGDGDHTTPDKPVVLSRRKSSFFNDTSLAVGQAMQNVRRNSSLIIKSMVLGGSQKSKASNESLKDLDDRKVPSDNVTAIRNVREGEVESFGEQSESEKDELSAKLDHDKDNKDKDTHSKAHHDTNDVCFVESFESIKNDDHESFTRTKQGGEDTTVAEYKSGN